MLPQSHNSDRHHRRLHALRTVAFLAVVAAIASPQLWAQTGRAQTGTAQATLRLTVRVVPVAMLPPLPQSKSDSGNDVTFNLPGPSPRMTVAEEVRPLAASVFPTLSSEKNLAGASLKTLTVVAR